MADRRISSLIGRSLGSVRAMYNARLFERLRHVAWAGLISLALYTVLLFEPIDQFLWLLQSRVADRNPSGDVVFVASDEELNGRES